MPNYRYPSPDYSFVDFLLRTYFKETVPYLVQGYIGGSVNESIVTNKT